MSYTLPPPDATKSTYQQVLPHVLTLVRRWREVPGAELEARFGTYLYPSSNRSTGEQQQQQQQQQHFRGGIDETFHRSILRKLDEYTGWTKVQDWQDLEDYFFEFTDPSLCDGVKQTIRTRVFANHDNNMSWTPEHVVKSSSIRESVLIHPCPAIDASGSRANRFPDNPLYDVRFSLKSENVIDDGAIFKNVIVNPFHVRLHQRKSYTMQGFVFSMSRVWSATAAEAAQISQRVDPPVYEFECECTRNEDATSLSDDALLALSLLMKMDDFQKTPSKVYQLIST